MKRLIVMVMLGISTASLHAANEPPAADMPKDETLSSTPKQPAPKEEPPQKTEYDKLPLTQLLAKANANDLVAQFELASRFNYGRGLPRNTSEALRWLRKAARAGQEDAARLLAVKLYTGHDTLPDFAEAMNWAFMLAEKGDLPAQLMLASMYANGEGTRRDLVQAYKWYAIAAVGAKRKGSEEEPKPDQVQSAIDNRENLASLLTDEQETLGQQLASDWWMKKHAAKEKPIKQKKPASK